MRSILPTLRLIRIANLPSPVADQVAAAAIAVGGTPPLLPLLPLAVASACLYHGGMALNDFADREEDARDRPERPIPSGVVSPQGAGVVGASLLAAGIGCAGLVSTRAALVATVLAFAIVAYDLWAKRIGRFGPWIMGVCRSLNWLLFPAALLPDPGPVDLGASVGLAALYGLWIAGVTHLARAEVSGMPRPRLRWIARSLGATPIAAVPLLPEPLLALPFVLILAIGFERTARSASERGGRGMPPGEPGDGATGPEVRRVVGWAVRGTILLAAAAAAGSGAVGAAIVLGIVFFLAAPIARRLPVT